MASPDPSIDTPVPPAKGWLWWHTAGLLLLTLLMFALCSRVSLAQRLPLWWGVMLLLSLAALLVGQGITGYWRGILIDSRNKMSLSRLQLVLWTVVIVSALIVLFFWRLRAGSGDPLEIAIPTQIWALLGISTTSLVGSSMVKTNKKNQTRNMPEENETLRKMSAQGQGASGLLVTGREVLNVSAEQASWADLFRGEESGNASTVSLGKFQMFYFTLVAVVSYGSALAQIFDAAVPSNAFPDVSSGLLGLLAISHGGYLAEKAVPHTQDPASEPLPNAAPPPAAAMSVAPAVGRTARPMGQP